jgi:hypothetical protein
MRVLPNTAVIWTDQLHANQAHVVAAVINKMARGLFLRFGRQLVVIHLPPLLPVHPKDVAQPHALNRSRIISAGKAARPVLDTQIKHHRFVAKTTGLDSGIDETAHAPKPADDFRGYRKKEPDPKTK